MRRVPCNYQASLDHTAVFLVAQLFNNIWLTRGTRLDPDPDWSILPGLPLPGWYLIRPSAVVMNCGAPNTCHRTNSDAICIAAAHEEPCFDVIDHFVSIVFSNCSIVHRAKEELFLADPFHFAIADDFEQRTEHTAQAAAGNNRTGFIAGMKESGIVLYALLLLARQICCRDRAANVEGRDRRQRHIEVAAMVVGFGVVPVVIRQFARIGNVRDDLFRQRHKIVRSTGDMHSGVSVFGPGSENSHALPSFSARSTSRLVCTRVKPCSSSCQ